MALKFRTMSSENDYSASKRILKYEINISLIRIIYSKENRCCVKYTFCKHIRHRYAMKGELCCESTLLQHM